MTTSTQSAKSILDSLGTPPQEVCLDWAWQLKSFESVADAEPLTWADVEIDPEGMLIPPAAVSFNTDSLCADVVQWIQAENKSKEEVTNLELFLQDQTSRHIQRQESEPVASAPIPTSSSLPKTITTPPIAPSKSSQKSKKEVRDWLRHPGVIVGGICLLVAIGITPFMFPGGEDGELAETLASTSNSDVSTEPPPRGPTTPKREDAVAEVPELQSIGPPVLPSTNESDTPRDMFEALGDLNNPASSTATMGDPTSQDESPAAREEQGSFTMPGAPGTEQYQAAEDTPEGSESEPMEAEQIDIMQSLDEATQQAKLKEQATDLEADVDGSPKPMMLPTFPMNQLVRLPSKFKVRAAKPVWKLQLEASEGFIVTPKTPQPLEARQSIQWIIAEEDADDEAPQILVLAQQQGSGGRALRFQIAVNVKGTQILLPFSKTYLDQVQANLAAMKTNLQAGIEQLRAMGRVDGIPSEMRSLLSARRRAMEDQYKMAERFLPTVSKASQMDGWLDGQFSIHAQFLDASEADSPPLLKFGSFLSTDEAPSDAAESDDMDAGSN